MASQADEEDADETEIGPPPKEPSVRPAGPLGRPCLMVLKGSSAGHVYALTEPETQVGRAPGNLIRLKDGNVSRVHARFILSPNGVVLEDLGSTGTIVNREAVKRRLLSDGDRIRLGESSELLFTYLEATEEVIESNLLASAMRDPLTGAWTRRRLIAQLEHELAYARRHGASISLVIALPQWSEREHEPDSILDAVIATVAERIREKLGPTELLARWSRTTFAICVRDADEHRVLEVTERVAGSVSQSPIFTDLGKRQVRLDMVPIAVATPATDSLHGVIMRADALARDAPSK